MNEWSGDVMLRHLVLSIITWEDLSGSDVVLQIVFSQTKKKKDLFSGVISQRTLCDWRSHRCSGAVCIGEKWLAMFDNLIKMASIYNRNKRAFDSLDIISHLIISAVVSVDINSLSVSWSDWKRS